MVCSFSQLQGSRTEFCSQVMCLSYVIFTGKAKIERESRDLKLKYGVLDSARSTVGKKSKSRVDVLMLFFNMLGFCFCS